MSLYDLAERFDLAKVQHLLVEDDSGQLLGVVDTKDVVARLSAPNRIERQRWANTPIASIVSIRLDKFDGSVTHKLNSPSVLNGRAFSQNEQLVAMNLGDDVMIRWSSVKNVLQRALFDSVTGLPNRAVFDRRLQEEWERTQSRNSSLAVLMIDLDHFKSINDLHGHSIGDQILNEVGQCLSTQLRSYDLLARFGGDEFAAILTDCYVNDIHIPATRLHTGIRQLGEKFKLKIPRLTVSIGAITCPGDQDVSPAKLLTAADDCMYAAKKAGRGCAYTMDLALSGRKAKPRPLSTTTNQTSAGLRVPQTR
jgi:diguanylate cyclase (GGDEF)-like protein